MLRALDALFPEDVRASFFHAFHVPEAFRDLLHFTSLRKLPAPLVRQLQLTTEKATPDAVRLWLDLPEQLAAASGQRLMIAIDELQELASLESKKIEPSP